MTNNRRPNITEAITEVSQPVVSSQEDQIQSYRRMARLRHEAQRRFSGRTNNTRTLESQLNPEAELELSQQRRASLVPAETLYSTQWSEPRHRVYQHYSETRILVTEGQQNLPLINPESYSILRQEGMQLIQLGLVMIHIHALHRRNAGTNALVVLRDTRWSDDRSITGTMEIDLSEDTQLVYIAPNLLISIEDFFHHIELTIQTHGYENWNSAESNLLITRGLIGRLTNTSHAGFRYNIQNVADYLASTGINAVPATPRTTAELQGMRWILQPPLAPQIRNPQAVRTTTLMDGSISLAFSGYQSTGNPKASRFNEKDIEDIHDEEFAGVLINEFPKGKKYKTGRWDTLGQPSGKFDYYVNYDIPKGFADIELPPPTGWNDEEDNDELVFPSIWEDTPWEEDPEFGLNDLTPPDPEGQVLNIEEYEVEEDGPETYFLGLQNQETDYPVQAPLYPDQQTINLENSDAESDLYWQQVVQHVEQIEAQLPLANCWYDPTPHDAIAGEFLDRLPQEGPENLWYEIYEYPEQHEEQQNHNWVSLNKQKGKSIMIHDTDDDEDFEDKEFMPSYLGKEKKEVTFNFLKVKKLTATTKIPERRTERAAGYDLFIDQDIEIPAKDRRLAKTGISIEFPKGHYARVTTRSRATIHLKIDIGAGVIDADYRGEIQLLVINHSNNAISLKEGDNIAQFILEKIITPQIEEVDFLSATTRGEGSFGSTDTRKETPCRLVHYMVTIQDIPDNQEELFMIIDAAVDETKDASLFIRSQLASTLVKASRALVRSLCAGTQEKTWNKAIKDWDQNSRIADLEYLNLATEYHTILKTLKENHCELTRSLEESFKIQQRLQKAVLELQKELLLCKPLTARDIKELVVEITKQPKLIDVHPVLSYCLLN
ncbi:hypothetical protein ZIOFF_006224 [Zingiber officinale]|uniref:dUTP diphosphatase n=1 Tax=Zingiber officinale TaxID=94328 RepID=A0A8J5IDY6_ZINOF|nr:hypothetical protein ZIOFF_006224 [Zingiber officinale]